MDKKYKAIPYKVTTHHDAFEDKDEPWNSEPAYDTSEIRYCIVSNETGEVLDDAQGDMVTERHKKLMQLMHIRQEIRVKTRKKQIRKDIFDNG